MIRGRLELIRSILWKFGKSFPLDFYGHLNKNIKEILVKEIIHVIVCGPHIKDWNVQFIFLYLIKAA